MGEGDRRTEERQMRDRNRGREREGHTIRDTRGHRGDIRRDIRAQREGGKETLEETEVES